MSDILLLDTDTETSLRATVRGLLAAKCDPGAVARAYEGDRGLTSALWTSLARDLGLAGLLIPEERGGAGGSVRDAAVVLEELGRYVAPVPFLTSSVIGATVLLAGDAELVGQVAEAAVTVGLLAPFTAACAAAVPRFVRDARGRLSGRVRSVAGIHEADVLLAVVESGSGTEVYAVPAAAATVTPVISLDMTRQLADVVLDSVPGELVVAAEAGDSALRAGFAAGVALLAAEQAGVAAWCLETTVSYLQTRRQFGRVVGGFQALKHRLADLFVDVESATAAARYAAGAIAASDADAEVGTAVAAAFCAEVAVKAAEEAIQLHGGIGMTWEYPAHLYLKRAKADQLGLGSPAYHRSVLADLVDLRLVGH
ncbi:alkylation response protein AidB-like acyl-CoA dehydrogenase [Nocardia tenerifensis]|uniref:Alkylation response protein AidB-like acyl-CoA dehydrogenase n=1 Tax=Nocardia tenerifensis TaxID=228006 RepID=A0A318KFF5_9NOCA|nr:acyl-CoA dehydrogenase family protein [Nocardia tenerifensis]PXX70972.1 alkylation response protein AidB-like acyl-CoA dehydrogenase [Nocardia tenerifensis]